VFTDPIVTTAGGAATISLAGGTSKSLARTGTNEVESSYKLVDTGNVETTLIIGHAPDGKRPSAKARLEKAQYIADPLQTGQNRKAELAVTVSFSWDPNLSIAEVQDAYEQLLSFLTPANALRVIGYET
jgi:hypothetical protein